MFSLKSNATLARSSLIQDRPVYVQFYITARCNLTCQQCNIIYSNSDVRECSIYEIEKIAENFAKMGVAIVLLTGGEPFVRKDLPEIIRAFESRGVHVRMQTNGLASEEQIVKCIEAGGKDISISLDSLKPSMQDGINGGFKNSWFRALNAMSIFTKHLDPKDSFASLGCVLQKNNLDEIKKVIKFGTKIGWFTSLVPIHVTNQIIPRGFRTFDQDLRFEENDFEKVDNLLDDIKVMKEQKYLLYDSEEYLENIKLFIRNEKITWRRKNENVCDSPNLYFALLPNGEFSPCCDFRIENSYPAYSKDFPKIYYEKTFRKEVLKVTKACSGCMYGSYPEISISMRFMMAKLQRIKNFIIDKPDRNWPVSYEDMLEAAKEIEREN